MTWGEIRNAQGSGGGKPEGKTPLRRMRRGEDIIKTEPKEVECECGGIRFTVIPRLTSDPANEFFG